MIDNCELIKILNAVKTANGLLLYLKNYELIPELEEGARPGRREFISNIVDKIDQLTIASNRP